MDHKSTPAADDDAQRIQALLLAKERTKRPAMLHSRKVSIMFLVVCVLGAGCWLTVFWALGWLS